MEKTWSGVASVHLRFYQTGTTGGINTFLPKDIPSFCVLGGRSHYGGKVHQNIKVITQKSCVLIYSDPPLYGDVLTQTAIFALVHSHMELLLLTSCSNIKTSGPAKLLCTQSKFEY